MSSLLEKRMLYDAPTSSLIIETRAYFIKAHFKVPKLTSENFKWKHHVSFDTRVNYVTLCENQELHSQSFNDSHP